MERCRVLKLPIIIAAISSSFLLVPLALRRSNHEPPITETARISVETHAPCGETQRYRLSIDDPHKDADGTHDIGKLRNMGEAGLPQLLQIIDGAGDTELRISALYVAARLKADDIALSRRISRLTDFEYPENLRCATYTALRFRRNYETVTETLLGAFQAGRSEDERVAAAVSLQFQRHPGTADAIRAIIPTEDSQKVKQALQWALSAHTQAVEPWPCTGGKHE